MHQLPKIASSDHFTILAKPRGPNENNKETKKVKTRDMRDSNWRAFGRWMTTKDWTPVMEDTFDRSFFPRITRTWNSLPEHLRLDNISLIQFRNALRNYYFTALRSRFTVNNPRTWRTVCLKCNLGRSLIQPLTCCY